MSEPRRLNLSLLERALQQLETALREQAEEPARRAFRDSVVMHYLFTCEPAIQAIKRFVALQSLKSNGDEELSFQKVIRRADELGVLGTGWPEFNRYREGRNAVTHTYSETQAMAVLDLAATFTADVRHLLLRIREETDAA
jgi:hypothetical protein